MCACVCVDVCVLFADMYTVYTSVWVPWSLMLDILAMIVRRWSESSLQIGTLQVAPLHVLSHFAANVRPQGLPQTLAIPAIQKDKVGLLQMSKFEASKDSPHIIHIELRLSREILSKLTWLEELWQLWRAAEFTARFQGFQGFRSPFGAVASWILSSRPSRDWEDGGYACTGEFQSLPLPPWKAHSPLRQHQSQNLDAGTVGKEDTSAEYLAELLS